MKRGGRRWRSYGVGCRLRGMMGSQVMLSLRVEGHALLISSGTNPLLENPSSGSVEEFEHSESANHP